MKPTPPSHTPWKELPFDEDTVIIYDKNMRVVIPKLRNKANAAFICLAVNAHEELLRSLKDAYLIIKLESNDPATPFIKQMERAIAKAEGVTK